MSNQRLIAALGQLEKVETNENEAIVALRFVNRMIKEKGISWSDIGEMIEGSQSKNTAQPDLATTFAQAFTHADGPMSSFFKKPEEARPRPQARSMCKNILQGDKIPKKIFGSIRVIEEREIRSGMMLVVTVEGFENIYSPLVIFDKAIIENLKQNDGPYKVIVQHSSNYNPKIVRISEI